MKDAKTGGAWAWHQDDGYWYQNGVLSPDLCSASIAVDPATRENGCLQVIEGSHLLGRVDHVLTGEQAGANKERVAAILERFRWSTSRWIPVMCSFSQQPSLCLG
jgi:ectoine hydroxylase